MSLSILNLILFILCNFNAEFSSLPLVNNHTIHTCGRPLRTGRILGGEQVTQYHTWPWMVSIRRWGHHVCGGVIISPLFILTAAHCVPSVGLSIAHGLIQQSNLTSKDPRIRAITKVYVYSNFSLDEMHHDLAILRLERPLRNKSFNIICLPNPYENISINNEVIAIGFGREKESSTRSSDYLRQVKLKILSPTSDRCSQDLTDPLTQLCVGSDIPNQDTCKGDSGGPLMFYSSNKSHYELIGIISFGTGCGHINHPGIYTRISAYINWIHNILEIN